MLLIKVGLVAVVAVMGYVNNRYALPALDPWRPATPGCCAAPSPPKPLS